ncbi:unnamed protein product [Zymoseptoria tritici ST99CH_3D1]|uniref:Uncharacterized protein n=1 Tax=Zymoseptoria tritici (strain ST99CH_3D7) TaxID=1276538 RepID=A0A1X7RY34_ZYMT9|nr:unnamed protein product [Zymoseptoria tritici ST99CH_3D7]SMR57388.1 unnamed protein product [Zymoseptoria tritici ST99CH_3D1]
MSRHYLRSLTRIFAVAILSFIFYQLLNTVTEPSHGNSAKFRPKREPPIVHEPVLLNETLADSKQSGDNAHGLFKRALHPECSDKEFEDSQKRGCELRDRLTRYFPYVVANVQHLHGSGWQENLEDDDPDMGVASFLENLAGVTEYPITDRRWRVRLVRGEFVAQTWSQWYQYPATMPDGTVNMFRGTGGEYRQISAPRLGVIVILDAWSPERMTSQPDDPLPPVSTWQQVGQAEYDRVFAVLGKNFRTNEHARIPNWVLIKTLVAPYQGLGVVTRCLRTAYGLTALPSWEHRVTFAIGTTCFDALLGTANAMPVGWLYVTKRLDWKAQILSITVFDSEVVGPNGDNFPSMLLHARAPAPGLAAKVTANEEFQAAADAEHRLILGLPPHPMLPLYLN